MSIELRCPNVGIIVMVPLGFDSQLSELNVAERWPGWQKITVKKAGMNFMVLAMQELVAAVLDLKYNRL
jgi:hypothetical protein